VLSALTLFPYTTLFRSEARQLPEGSVDGPLSGQGWLRASAGGAGAGAHSTDRFVSGLVGEQPGRLSADSARAWQLHGQLCVARADRKSTRLNSSHEWTS